MDFQKVYAIQAQLSKTLMKMEEASNSAMG